MSAESRYPGDRNTPHFVLSPDDRRALLELARRAVAAHLSGEEPPAPARLSPALSEPRGVFVSLHKAERLRGCIGELTAERPLWEAVRHEAVQAAARDQRFPPLSADELPECAIEISVLTPLLRTQAPEQLRPGTDGACVIGRTASGERRTGCFLPQVAERTDWSAEEFLTALCRDKARLAPDAWRDPQTEVYLFQAVVFGE